MIRTLILSALLLSTPECFSQLDKVSFTESSFTNGMKYPQLSINDKATQDSINADITKRVSDLEKSDFCIGQFGYVQKRTHLQIHIFCNCIDFDTPENRYLFYNLIDGKAVPYSDIIETKKQSELNTFILAKIKQRNPSIPTEQIKQSLETQGIDIFQIVMQRDGLDLWYPQIEEWGEKPMFLSWVELTPFLKYQFM